MTLETLGVETSGSVSQSTDGRPHTSLTPTTGIQHTPPRTRLGTQTHPSLAVTTSSTQVVAGPAPAEYPRLTLVSDLVVTDPPKPTAPETVVPVSGRFVPPGWVSPQVGLGPDDSKDKDPGREEPG